MQLQLREFASQSENPCLIFLRLIFIADDPNLERHSSGLPVVRYRYNAFNNVLEADLIQFIHYTTLWNPTEYHSTTV